MVLELCNYSPSRLDSFLDIWDFSAYCLLLSHILLKRKDIFLIFKPEDLKFGFGWKDEDRKTWRKTLVAGERTNNKHK